jgi:hypothetical protein
MANVSKEHNDTEHVRGATVEKETMLRSCAVPEGASQLTLGRVRHLFLVTITGAVASHGKKLDLPRCKAISAVAPRFVKPVSNTQASIMKHSSEIQDTRLDG